MASLPSTGILGGSLGLPTGGILGVSGSSIIVTGIDVAEVPDDGGVKITLTGAFPIGVEILVNVTDGAKIDRRCFSGVPGQGSSCFTEDGATLSFVSPPLPPSAVRYDLVLVPDVGSPLTVPEALLAVHRTFAANLFSLRSVAARPRYVGAYTIEDED
jgi:hypothetical protein